MILQNHSNMLIWCSRKFLIFLWKAWYVFLRILWRIESYAIEINKIVNVFSITFDHLNACVLAEYSFLSTNKQKKDKKLLTPNLRFSCGHTHISRWLMVIWLTRSSSTPAGGDISAEPFWVSESTCDLAQVKSFTDIYFQWIYFDIYIMTSHCGVDEILDMALMKFIIQCECNCKGMFIFPECSDWLSKVMSRFCDL